MEVPKSQMRKKKKKHEKDEQTLALRVRSVHTTSVKILPYRPPARLIGCVPVTSSNSKNKPLQIVAVQVLQNS